MAGVVILLAGSGVVILLVGWGCHMVGWLGLSHGCILTCKIALLAVCMTSICFGYISDIAS